MNKLQFWRRERGLTQYELSEASGVPRYVIQLCERAICLPNKGQLEAIMETLGVVKKDLFPSQIDEGDCDGK